jgi:hypothetical protein
MSARAHPARGRRSRPGARQQPMTSEQAARLKALAGQALEPEAFRPVLTATEAARRIRALEVKLETMDGPPHTI